MEKVIGIFDEQNAYAERFKRYINDKKDLGCFAVSFQKEQELEEYCCRKKLNYLVLGEAQAEKAKQVALPYGVRIWVLSEEEPEEEEADGYQIVFRYQKAGEVIRRIMQAELAREQRLSEIYTVFSPESSLLAEEYTEQLLTSLAKKGKTLFLPWDSFGGFGRTEEGGRQGASISELLYLMRKDRTQAKQLFTGLPKKNGADYFCSPEYCTDLWQFSPEEMHQLVSWRLSVCGISGRHVSWGSDFGHESEWNGISGKFGKRRRIPAKAGILPSDEVCRRAGGVIPIAGGNTGNGGAKVKNGSVKSTFTGGGSSFL